MLVSAAHFGAMTLGADIDMRVLKGKGGKTLSSNFRQYNFPMRLIDVVHFDLTNSAIVRRPIFDSIITDPPYGVRAGARKVGKKPKTLAKEAGGEEHVVIDPDTHFPQVRVRCVRQTMCVD